MLQKMKVRYRDSFNQQINPKEEEDAMVDYRGAKRLTPSAALEEISQLRQSGEIDNNQHQLLDELEAYVKDRFGC